MNILIVTPILFEKASPFNHLMRDILKGLLDAGHQITRIIAVENEVDTDYRMGLNGIKYIPVIRKRSQKTNVITRYMTDMLANIKMARLIKTVHADVLFEDVSYSSYWSVRAAKRLGIRVVSMLQDVWPDNAVQSGLLKANGVIYSCFELLQKKVYKLSDKLICISDDMKKFIELKSVPDKKIYVIYNWGCTDKPVDITWENNAFVREFGLKKELFYVIYAGNIGRMQNVELIVKAADVLADYKNIFFLIIGDGVKKDAIREVVSEKRLENVRLLPLQPAEMATAIYSAGGVNIVPLVADGIKTALPSKTGVIFSCGGRAIFCFGKDSKFSKIIELYNAGKCVDSDDVDDLVRCILDYQKNQYEKNGMFEIYNALFSRRENVQKYMELIQND